MKVSFLATMTLSIDDYFLISAVTQFTTLLILESCRARKNRRLGPGTVRPASRQAIQKPLNGLQ